MAFPLRVLIVEDAENHAAAVLAELKRGDYALTSERVGTEAEFQAALKQGGWTVILCDFLLPDFSGMDALAMVQQTGCGVGEIGNRQAGMRWTSSRVVRLERDQGGIINAEAHR